MPRLISGIFVQPKDIDRLLNFFRCCGLVVNIFKANARESFSLVPSAFEDVALSLDDLIPKVVLLEERMGSKSSRVSRVYKVTIMIFVSQLWRYMVPCIINPWYSFSLPSLRSLSSSS